MRVPVKKLSAFVHQEFTDLLQIDADLAFLHNDHHQLQSKCNKNAMMIKKIDRLSSLVKDLWKCNQKNIDGP